MKQGCLLLDGIHCTTITYITYMTYPHSSFILDRQVIIMQVFSMVIYLIYS